MLEPLRHFENPYFNAIIFRRTTPQIMNPGALWDEALKLYAPMGAQLKISSHECIFPSGMKVKFAHLEEEKTVYEFQGAQIPLICFEELTHFTETQFWFMFSRNRSTCGVPAYIRATTNPDKNSWVRALIDWWIGEDGLPVRERAGVIRWFVRVNNELIWGDSKEELLGKFPDELPTSFTFIPATLEDNQIFVKADPKYRAKLRAMQLVDRLRMEGGNWDVVESAGMMFKRHWFPIVDAAPIGTTIRYWDRAATEPHPGNKDPDYTVGLKFTKSNLYYVEDVVRDRLSPGKVEDLILRTAKADGKNVVIVLEQDPGQAGKSEVARYLKLLAGYVVKFVPARQDKVTRAKPVSAQAEHHNIVLVRGKWNEDFLKETEAFPDKKWHDDQVDTLSGAFNFMIGGVVGTFTESMVTSNVRPIASGIEW